MEECNILLIILIIIGMTTCSKVQDMTDAIQDVKLEIRNKRD